MSFISLLAYLASNMYCFLHQWPRCTFVSFLFLFYFSLNHLAISSSKRRGGLPSGCFRPLRYQPITARVHLLSTTLQAEILLCDHFLHSTLFPNYLALVELSVDLSIALCAVTSHCSFFFAVGHISLAYYIADKIVFWKVWFVGWFSALPWANLLTRYMPFILISFSTRFTHHCLGICSPFVQSKTFTLLTFITFYHIWLCGRYSEHMNLDFGFYCFI